MRAKEFVINIPISITMNSDGSVDVNQPGEDAVDPSQVTDPRRMVPPLQQALELAKAQVGKTSPVIQSLTQDEVEPADEDDFNQRGW